ncbi:AAA family ATPase [Acidimicrobiales bacterium]|nr:AAA family ATPase [Acidimicrobiales bacterium]
MNELADEVQRTALAKLGNRTDQDLERFRPALKELRHSYRSNQPPDFSNPQVRAAYVFAYHTHHCLLAAAALAAAGPDLLGLRGKESATLTILGAGPAAEFVAFSWVARDLFPELEHVDVHLVDKEHGWEKTRRTTVDSTVSSWWPGDYTINHHTADLGTRAGLADMDQLVESADLVIAQAVITEVPNPLGEGGMIDHLLDSLGVQSRLLLIDLNRVKGFDQVEARVDALSGSVVIGRAEFDVVAARPIPPLDTQLFDYSTDGLMPRGTLHCSMRLVSRLGSVGSQAVDDEFIPTPSQAGALEKFDQFLTGTNDIFVLRGAAGTGKTALFPSLVHRSAGVDLPVVLLAPTGQAAQRLRGHVGRPGATIHSQIYQYERADSHADDEAPPASRFALRAFPQTPALYLVDECSLIGDHPDSDDERDRADVTFGDGRLLNDLIKFTSAVPGSKIVVVGDLNQLPPVGEQRSPALDTGYLESTLGLAVQDAELAEVVRHNDSPGILRFAHNCLESMGRPDRAPGSGVEEIRAGDLAPWLWTELLTGEAVIVGARHADVRGWNQRVRERAGRSISAPETGDRLVTLRPDLRTGLANGDELEIVATDDAVARVQLRDDSVELRNVELRTKVTGIGSVTFNAVVVDSLLHGASMAEHRAATRILHVDFIRRTGLRPGDAGFDEKYRQDERVQALRVVYSYARTCHRAQGGEWDNVVVDFAGSGAFGEQAGRWAYTAVTRARESVYIVHPPRPAVLSTEALAGGAVEALLSAGIHAEVEKAIQHGVQLKVSENSTNARINVWAKNGLPSSASPTGPRVVGDLRERAIDILETWIGSEARAEEEDLPLGIQRHAGRIATLLSRDGFDVEARQRAAYEAEFTIRSFDTEASLVFSFSVKDDGTLGHERAMSASGDLTLVHTLRSAIRDQRT